MCYFLLVRRTPATIGDISTTFMGVFYGAYLPSFWVRLRAVGTGFPTVSWAGVRAIFPWYPMWAPLPVPDTITQVSAAVNIVVVVVVPALDETVACLFRSANE